MPSGLPIDFAVNSKLELAGYASREDWAITIDETQSIKHCGTARANDLTHRARFCFGPVGSLRRWINTKVKTIRIEWRWLRQFLRQIVFRHAAVRWNAKVRSQECGKGKADQHPIVRQGQRAALSGIRQLPDCVP